MLIFARGKTNAFRAVWVGNPARDIGDNFSEPFEGHIVAFFRFMHVIV